MDFLERQIAKINRRGIKIVYPEGTEPTILLAAEKVASLGFAVPVLLGETDKIRKTAEEYGISLEGMELIYPPEEKQGDEYAKKLAEKNGLPMPAASVIMKKPLYFGAMMVNTGDADCIVAGAATETNEVIAAYKMMIGMADGVKVPSCITILEIPGFEGSQGEFIALSDTAVNIDPTSEELADIAIASANSIKKMMDWEPRVAMLSFSTCGSANHECAEKVARAVRIAQEREPELLIDGEMQLDAAIRPNIAERKMKKPGKVAGRANVLIFPNLDAGNIGTKLLQCIGKAQSYGGILQGFAKPVSDVSRGATVENVLRISVMLGRMASSENNI